MPAYSGGNRWVGKVGLRTPPPSEPLHRMAQRRAKVSLNVGTLTPIDIERYSAMLVRDELRLSKCKNAGKRSRLIVRIEELKRVLDAQRE